MLLNSPSNPTGAVYTAAERSSLAKGMYEHILYDGRRSGSLAAVARQLAVRTLTVA